MSRLVVCLLLLAGCAGEEPEKAVATPRDRDGDGADVTVDCNDHRADVYPGAAEVCDGVDQDCDNEVDEDAVDAGTWYADGDGDGFGAADTSAQACTKPDGMVRSGDDCDDAHAESHPGAAEVCDALDNNCDGQVDVDPVDGVTVYPDADGDGYGANVPPTRVCETSAGEIFRAGDCDDANPMTHPGGVERCGGADEDCDGEVDEADALGTRVWLEDTDGDGFGDDTTAVTACASPYAGGVTIGGDCALDDAEVNPGEAERCDDADGRDDDCDGVVDPACWSGTFSWTTADLDGALDLCVATLAGEEAPWDFCPECDWTWTATLTPELGCRGIDELQFGILGPRAARALVQVELSPLGIDAHFDAARGWLDMDGTVLNEVDGVVRSETVVARVIVPVP